MPSSKVMSYLMISATAQNQLRSLAWAGVDDRIALAGTLGILSGSIGTQNRVTGCWAFGVLAISSLGTASPITLLTAEIGLIATHNTAAYPIGTVLYFVSEDGNNTTLSRTVLSKLALGPPISATGGDITVIRLSSALPASVRPARILSANWQNYILPENNGIPLFEFKADTAQATVTNFNGPINPSNPDETLLFTSIPSTSPRSDYYVAKAAGDSSSGCGLIVNGEFIFGFQLSFSTFGGTGWGAWNYLAEIQSAIFSLGSATTLSIFDPSTVN